MAGFGIPPCHAYYDADTILITTASIAALGADKARAHIFAFTGENSIISALLLSVLIPLTAQPNECVSGDE
jgi:hypothetical protein